MSDKADLYEKTDRYHRMLEEALSNLLVTKMGEEIEKIVDEFLTMAESYYRDGIHFRKEGDMVNALICFTYGHGWIDAGVRLGIFAVNK
jgi:hypothetical protein